MIVPTLCVGMQPGTLRVPFKPNAERPLRHSHGERGNDKCTALSVDVAAVAALFDQALDFSSAEHIVEHLIHA